jgi:L-threonylcarbamoyladenylate synthase|tara:strand:- start:883 stop:1866 length:984 start_codon:yes stop_codon:yes gene_type:complete
MSIQTANSKSIKQAADVLRAGGLVAMPTETVYGLAANALDGQAVARIFAAKGRPQINPLIVHVTSVEQAMRYVEFDIRAQKYADHFWPGPLTLILKKKQGCGISELVSAGLPTIGLRCPAHPVAQQLLKASDLPLAAPSANASGTISPTAPIHVAESLGDKVDMILSGGNCDVGLESTILDLSGAVPIILRPGTVTAEDLAAVEGITPEIGYGNPGAPTSPGQLLKHYAPNANLRLNAIDVAPDEALLGFGSLKFMGVKGGGFAKDLPDGQVLNLSEGADLYQAASHLFAYLRRLDNAGYKNIAVMNIPDTGLGVAINDRLTRAARK